MGCKMSLIKSCGGSAAAGEEDQFVSVCKERKRLMKSAVDRRYILAGAHCKYNQSLYAVALALRFFISRHSTSQFLITFPEPNPTTPPADELETVCEHFYDDVVGGPTVTPEMTSSTQQNHLVVDNDYYGGWDFFSPLNNILVNNNANAGASAGPGPGASAAAGAGDVIELAKSKVEDKLIDDDVTLNLNGRELLDALKHVEDYFLKAYDSGSEFSKMLEFTDVTPLDSKENFTPSINIYKSSITRSPSCASLLSSSSRSSFTWTGINSSSDLFDYQTGGMESGSHLSTLGRLYAWENKLYDEVKAGNEMKKIYDRKSSKLSSGDGDNNRGGIEDQVNDLYSRLLVNVKMCDSISKRIEKVRDEELMPQLIELLRGFIKTWKVMLESHKSQSQIMFKVKNFSFSGNANDRCRHLATLQLEAEIQNWCKCFATYIASTEAYIEDLSQWAYISKHTPPPVFSICRNWLNVIKNLPCKAVTYAMKRFAKDLRTLWAHQEIEQQQKRKVDRLVAAFDKEERNIRNLKSTYVKNKAHVLAEKKAQLDHYYTNIVEAEKAKHKECVEEMRRIILVGFQTGFSCVFDSLTEFCEVCVSKYRNVAQNATLGPNPVHGY